MVLVTGGTGLVGSHLLYFLLKENETVRAIHRENSDLESVKRVFGYYASEAADLFDRIEWIEANIIDIPALSEAFQDITHVYHCAAYISFDPAHYRKLKKANVEGTANIVNLCLSHGIKKLAYVSSVATLGDAVNGKMISEDTHWNPEGENSVYAITKFGAEMEVWRGTQEGLNAVIVNPGVILGSGYWNSGSGSIIKTASKGIPFYFGGGIGIVDVKDVVRILLQLMKEEITGQRYVLVSANVSYKKLLSAIANNAGKSPPKKEAPKWILYFLSGLDWLAAVLFGSKRRLLKATVRSMYTDTAYDASKIRNELKYKFIRFEDTIERVVKNYSSEVSSGSVS
ncbi:MAG: NAD-dependent epimerase/dehydratase family protein [Flavobacteriales bacterium]|uniref:NAD-dependent epimerase/dehydratase family protein n=1 Tax=Candidatus Ulvibacter alkanivorans TaxID=2267620 RepID=UPI000DF21525|nr:NAD-dependent epimerase/dehydratase family protein [Candidatus Ulvibacter alkanivorans]MCH2490355.1 NAD-dependent epimerase/dehydratase family protein [Flavobacteriales bacterium]